MFRRKSKVQPPSPLELQLTEILAHLPTPIRIVRHEPDEGGIWYKWKALLTGTGDTGTFEAAVEQSLTYVMQELRSQAAPGTRILRPEQPSYDAHSQEE